MEQTTPTAQSRSLCSREYIAFLERLAIQTLFRYNCAKIGLKSRKEEVLSSPFVSSIAARILFTFPGHSFRDSILLKTKGYLLNVMDENGLVGFVDPNRHHYDLDTLACVYDFLYRFQPELTALRINKVLKFFLENKCYKTGAYYTWIDKKKNNIDYFVNVNIRIFFKTIGFRDAALDEFLFSNTCEFIDKGSHYYQDISFPVLLAYLYLNEARFTSQDKYFVAALKRLLSSKRAEEIIEDIRMRVHQRAHPDIYGKVRIFPQYFNSKDGFFQSGLLDSIIHYYVMFNID
jgi:hypothetical protein